MITRTFPVMTILLAGLLLTGCVSVETLVETGNYDQAVARTVQRLAGKQNKKTRYVLALEEAFEKATERDMRAAEALKQENRPENWPRINDIYHRIQQRQALVEPLLPLIDQEGIKADFRFVKVEGLLQEARGKAVAYHYDLALELLRQARQGDKIAARRAYDELVQTQAYFRNYRDREELMDEAVQLGTTNVLVEVDNQAPVVLPHTFEAELTRLGVADLNRPWLAYYTNQAPGIEFDYRIVLSIRNIDVSPAVINEREYEETREIEDGFEYILDERGNVLKDSLGNDVKVPRRIQVRAWVLETFQQKAARVSGQMEVIDQRSYNLLQARPFAAEAVFEHYASTFRGDEHALSRETRKRLGNRPVPFPSDEALILQVVDQLKPLIKERIAATRVIS